MGIFFVQDPTHPTLAKQPKEKKETSRHFIFSLDHGVIGWVAQQRYNPSVQLHVTSSPVLSSYARCTEKWQSNTLCYDSVTLYSIHWEMTTGGILRSRLSVTLCYDAPRNDNGGILYSLTHYTGGVLHLNKHYLTVTLKIPSLMPHTSRCLEPLNQRNYLDSTLE